MPKFDPPNRELESALAVAGFLQLTKCTLVVRRRAAKHVVRLFGLSARELWILLAARCRTPVTQKQIARHLALNENVLVLLLDRLEKSGHARRVRNPSNRREQFVRLTPKGETIARRALAEKAKFYRTILAPLDDASIQTLFKAAKTILSSAGTAERRSRDSG